jgi:hypothetical protein
MSPPAESRAPFLLLPTIAMSVGWALRGTIGGGSFGAMIPGALVALALGRALGLPAGLGGRLAAFGAIGIGFGGQETYGQTVGFVTSRGDLFWHGLAGITLKGTVWGLVGGAVLATGFALPRRPGQSLLPALALLVAGTWLGWWLIDDPKRLYFSNRLDRPRPEVWAGLLMGGLAFLAALHRAAPPLARLARSFALHGAVGGGLGFGGGILLYAGGEALGLSPRWFSGWKVMEFTFGAVLGAALGTAAWRLRSELRAALAAPPPATPQAQPSWPDFALGLGAGLLLWLGTLLPVRFDFTVAGALALALLLRSEGAAWQVAVTTTVGAFAVSVAAHRTGGPVPPVPVTAALLLALGTGVLLARRLAAGAELPGWAFRFILASATGAALLQAARSPAPSPAGWLILAAFVGGSAAAIALDLRRPVSPPAAL